MIASGFKTAGSLLKDFRPACATNSRLLRTASSTRICRVSVSRALEEDHASAVPQTSYDRFAPREIAVKWQSACCAEVYGDNASAEERVEISSTIVRYANRQ